MSPPTPYSYAPLSSTYLRLLHLAPSPSPSAPFHGILTHHLRSSAPPYEALSYVWGHDSFPNTLHLPSGQHLMVTDNLAAALKRLRLSKKPRILWVDAVCINQSNGAEKGQQVAQMADIYANAARVVAWLGEKPGISLDLGEIVGLSQRVEEIGLQSHADRNREVVLKWVYGVKERVDWLMRVSDAAQTANFYHLYESAWLTRMWIVPETLLADHLTLCFGAEEVEWPDFERVMMLLHAVDAAIALPMPSREVFVKHAWSLVEVRDRWRRSSSLRGLPNESDQAAEMGYYMHQLRRRSCKDDRDRVFALQGLLRGGSGGLIIQPDYAKSAVQVFVEFARGQLSLGNVGMLYDAGLWKRKAFQMPDMKATAAQASPEATWENYLPTWAPDYRPDTTYMELDTRFGSCFGRNLDVPLALDLSMEPYRLRTQATLIDIITFVQPAMFVHDTFLRADDIAMFLACRQFIKSLKQNFDVRFRGGRRYPVDDEDLRTVMAYTLVGGGTDEEYKKHFSIPADTNERPDPRRLWEIYEKCCLEEDGEVYRAILREVGQTGNRQALRGVGIDFYNGSSVEAGTAWRYHHNLVSIFQRHWFFISDDGYVGLAPRNTQSVETSLVGGDVLAFIDGANVPFVLRDLGEEADDHVLVGPCYIHRVMDGEEVKRKPQFSAGMGMIQII